MTLHTKGNQILWVLRRWGMMGIVDLLTLITTFSIKTINKQIIEKNYVKSHYYQTPPKSLPTSNAL